MKKIFGLIFSILFISDVAHASAPDQALITCLDKIYKNDSAWQSGVTNIFGNADLNDAIVEQEKARIYDLLSKRIATNCASALVTMAKTNQERAIIGFKHKDKEYGFDFDLSKILDNVGIQTGILVINKRNLYPTQVLKLSDIPKKQKFFSDECSDWTIADNLDDDAAVNVAGQSVFTDYGGSKNEFFLDFADGDNRRAFPGLLLMDKTGSTEEKIVTYFNLKTAVEKTYQFAEKLKNTPCSIDNNLAVYLVALNVQTGPVTTSANDDLASGWTAGTGAAVGAATIGIGAAALHTTGAAAAFGALAGATGAAAVVPLVGWGIAIVTGTVAASMALYPNPITDIQQVMILDGPYDI